MARGLTVKQAGFARLVAGGLSKTEALERAYPSSRRNRFTTRVQAHRLSRIPKVAAEIERLALEHFLPPFDIDRLAEHAVAVMVILSNTGSERTRFQAAKWLAEYTQSGLALHDGRAAGKEPQDIIAGLRALYRKALVTEAKEA